MPHRVRRLVPKLSPIQEFGAVSELSDPPAISIEAAWEEVWEWDPEDVTETWTEWNPVSTVEDPDPTYMPRYGPGIFFPRLVSLEPHRKRTTTWERKLLRRWVDREQGPMGMVAHTETRIERS